MDRRLKAFLCSAGVIVAVSCINSFVFAASSSKFAAKVNGVGIKSETLDIAVNNFVERQKVAGRELEEKDKAALRKAVLDELISAELLYQESKRAGLGDLKEEIDKQYENIKKGFASNDEFKKILKERGITEKELKEDIEKGVYINTYLQQKLYPTITISEEEKRAEYERHKDKLDVPDQVRASHILIKIPDKATDSDRQKLKEKIESIRQRALSGEDFAKLAQENSEDGTASRGGDLGYFAKGVMIKPFEEAAFSLTDIGQISPVVETQFGYHIIKLLDKVPAHTMTYEEVEPALTRYLENQAREKKIDELVESLKKKAKIEIY